MALTYATSILPFITVWRVVTGSGRSAINKALKVIPGKLHNRCRFHAREIAPLDIMPFVPFSIPCLVFS